MQQTAYWTLIMNVLICEYTLCAFLSINTCKCLCLPVKKQMTKNAESTAKSIGPEISPRIDNHTYPHQKPAYVTRRHRTGFSLPLIIIITGFSLTQRSLSPFVLCHPNENFLCWPVFDNRYHPNCLQILSFPQTHWLENKCWFYVFQEYLTRSHLWANSVSRHLVRRSPGTAWGTLFNLHRFARRFCQTSRRNSRQAVVFTCKDCCPCWRTRTRIACTWTFTPLIRTRVSWLQFVFINP